MSKIITSISIILFGMPISTYAQCDSLFKGKDLWFKETNYYEAISRLFSDTTVSYSHYTIDGDGNIQIEDYAILGEDDVTRDYLPFKFFKSSDSLFIKYFNPTEKKEMIRYQYPLNKRDTLIKSPIYRIHTDSTIKKINDTTYSVKRWMEDYYDSPNYDITFKGDTIINVLSHKLNCYKVEMHRDYHNDMELQIILIEKSCLIPIEEIEYINRTHWVTLKGGPPRKKWILSRVLRLIDSEH